MKSAFYVLSCLVVIQFGVLIGNINNFVDMTFAGEAESFSVHEVAPQIGVTQYSSVSVN